jgi:hypothetical protein
MGAAVHSLGAAVGVALEVSPAAIRPEVFQVVIPPEAFPAGVSRVATVGEAATEVAEAVSQSWQINSKEDHLILFFCGR